MVRGFRRAGRRRARRLRRLRRARRYYGRRRFRRFRRYRRRRGYGRRRRRFYSRKGQKTAIAYLTPKGYTTRTYRYFLTKFMIQDYDGGWRSGRSILDEQPADVSWNITYGKTYTWAEIGALSEQVKLCTWTGPGNVYSVTEIPASISRVLGYDCYTIIHLSWYSQVFLQAINFFNNQKRLIKYDLHNYSFYKPISVTCKLCPKYPRPPSKFGYGTVSRADMFVYQPPAIVAGTDTGSTVNPAGVPSTGILVDPQVSKFKTTNIQSGSLWDTDAENLVGYIIPLAGQGVVGAAAESAIPAAYSTIFASLGRTPTNEFISAFRKAGYSRATISTNRPTRFVYKFTRTNLHDHLYLRPTQMNNRSYLLPDTFWSNFYVGGNAVYAPFQSDGLTDNLKNYWITADMAVSEVIRTRRDLTSSTQWLDSQEIWYTRETPIDAAVVFIPGITSEQLWTKYNLQFSYKCAYAGRTYDIS